MPIIEVVTRIAAPLEVCFDLARDIDLHIQSTAGTNELAVAGVTTGLIGPGDEVTWEATHFGIRHRLASRITAFDRPHRFRDSQVSGPFRRFDHDHIFSTDSTATVMRDVFDYESPLGWLGRFADILFLKRYMKSFLEKRSRVIRDVAQSRFRLTQ
jgi:ligand-binding SRPBCC domain-containing protein